MRSPSGLETDTEYVVHRSSYVLCAVWYFELLLI